MKKNERVAPTRTRASSPTRLLGASLRKARDSYLATKSCITRSVFMGMLKMAGEKHSFPLARIVMCPELDSDGTIFKVKDVRGICASVFRAWMHLNKQPALVEKQMDLVLQFLRSQSKKSMLPMMMNAEYENLVQQNCTAGKKEWENFKISLQDAEVIPVDLMVIRMRRDGLEVPAALLNLCCCKSEKKKMLSDWHECRHWFVPHLLQYHNQTGGAVVQQFSDWGNTVHPTHCTDHQTAALLHSWEQEEETANNDVHNDQFHLASRSSAASNLSTQDNNLLLTAEQKKAKAKAGPMHAMVVEAAKKAIETSCRNLI